MQSSLVRELPPGTAELRYPTPPPLPFALDGLQFSMNELSIASLRLSRDYQATKQVPGRQRMPDLFGM